MPTKVTRHPLNFGTVAAIFINVVSRHSKLDMRDRMRPLTAPSHGKLRGKLSYLENGTRYSPISCELQSCRALLI